MKSNQLSPVALFCRSDLTRGVQTAARTLAAAEQGVHGGIKMTDQVLRHIVIPEVKKRLPTQQGEWLEGVIELAGTIQFMGCTEFLCQQKLLSFMYSSLRVRIGCVFL